MRLRWTPEAAENLESIFNYLSLNHPEFAHSTIVQIRDELRALRTFPLIGRRVQREGLRALLMTNVPYICLYKLHSEAVIVINIYHSVQERAPDLQ